MKDNIILLVTAAIAALLAWAFWRFLGQHAFSVISTLALLIVTADNLRLRRKLKSTLQR
ncbi:hypothetical protein M1B72_21135 [Geomonas paludis]|uniref:Uncharacterized protein n=1 Tax=Geomonas paludis TaxID=2740185 RepID=A0ABY4LD46_9BACT|nr:hypothetical protein [Geomonas paludis]UPU35915.1 hypothetical protein M1B72_21135 [Geomonas paludis]